MYSFEHLAELHAAASEEMPDSKNVRAIESRAQQEGFNLEQLKARSLEIGHG